MARRIEGKIDAILSEDQFWFRKNMGTCDAILVLRGTSSYLMLTFRNL